MGDIMAEVGEDMVTVGDAGEEAEVVMLQSCLVISGNPTTTIPSEVWNSISYAQRLAVHELREIQSTDVSNTAPSVREIN